MRALFSLLLLAGALLWGTAAQAHKPSDSYLTLRANPNGSTVTARWDIALRDLDYVLQLDRDTSGAITWGEVRQRADDITRYATERLALAAGDAPCTWESPGPLMLDRHSDGTYAVLDLTARCPPLVTALSVRYSLLFDVDRSHRGLVQWLTPDADAPQALVFGVDSASQSLPLRQPGAWQTFRQYLLDGMWHIWIGYDHILFLLALLLPAVLVRHNGRWQGTSHFRSALVAVLKVVTAFTVAHSITLSLAALGLVSLPSRLVESAIAASVIVAALHNLRPGHSDAAASRRWVMAFAFGLIHGFGFASVLADLGLPAGALALALVGFNVGVELGQLAIVAVFLPLAFVLRNSRFYLLGVFRAGSVVVALLASWWLAQRLFDL